MCSSTNAPGSSASRLRLQRPASPPRERRRRRAAPRSRSAASIAATTPSAPSKRPAVGTLSRCDPLHTRARPAATVEVARGVDRRLEASAAQPPRSKRVRRVLFRRVPGAVLRDRVDLLEPVENAGRRRHLGNGRSTRQAASGNTRRRRSRPPGGRGDECTEESRIDGSREVQDGLLESDRRPAAARAGHLEGGGEREGVPAHGDDDRGDRAPARALRSAR